MDHLLLLVVCGAAGAAAGPWLARLAWMYAVPYEQGRRPLPPGGLPFGRRRGLLASGAAAAACAATAQGIGPHLSLAAYLPAAALGVPLAVVDLKVQRLPNHLLLPLYPWAVAVLGIAAAVGGTTGGTTSGSGGADLLRALEAMAALYVCYYLLFFVSGGQVGFGDVKLAGLLGLLLGWLGWPHVVVGVLLGSVLAAVAAVVLLATRRAGRKDSLPLGPFLLAGALVAVLW